MYEIIWHGRGGQGVVLASEVLAEAAYLQGYKGVTSAPTFGPERRGAPLAASTRISHEPIRTFSQIEHADIAVVLDDSLFKVVDIWGRLKEGGIMVVNSSAPPAESSIVKKVMIIWIDAAAVAREHRLTAGGTPVVNTPLLGALVKGWNYIALENIEQGLAIKMAASGAYKNFQAVKSAFSKAVIREYRGTHA
ncbi:MAG: 2-oxoacid:acceptor oxidoreductase family protein [Syntrophales bacterium]|nr:2-oxoacid:acceptor oxidoreductase family protein [Syntrophales bacterium]